MTDIIKRLQDATQGSRQLDAFIQETIFPVGNIPHPPHYTTSIDAAMTLAGDAWVSVLDTAMFMLMQAGGQLADLPRYICIAALSARKDQA